MKTRIERMIERGTELIDKNGMNVSGEYWYSSSVKEYEKDEIHRLYINLSYGRYYKGSSKWKRGVTVYIDLRTNKVVDASRMYNNARERDIIFSIANELAQMN